MRSRRGKEEPFVAGEKPAARRLAPAIRNAMHAASVDSHHVLLVAGGAFACALKREPLAVVAEVCFSVLATECYLPQLTKVTLAGST